MKIIKEGVDPSKTYRFVCVNCGCVYEELDSKCGHMWSEGKCMYIRVCNCPMPFCHNSNFSTEIVND
jgi:hypothetical protein